MVRTMDWSWTAIQELDEVFLKSSGATANKAFAMTKQQLIWLSFHLPEGHSRLTPRKYPKISPFYSLLCLDTR